MGVSNIITHFKKRQIWEEPKNYRYSILAFWFFLIFAAGYLLKSPINGGESVRSALNVCAYGLIPGIFPFIVLVNMISHSGLPALLSKSIGKPLSVIFRINERAAYAFILGIFGGFPIGAVCVGELYKDGSIDKREAERLCAAVNVASPAFCIGAIGSIFSDVSFGIRLYICQLAAAFTVMLLSGGRRSAGKEHPAETLPSPTKIMTDAISEGGKTMLKICSYVVFFAVIGDGVSSVMERFFGETAAALSAAFLEITLAARKASLLSSPLSMLICAFSVGYSGLSVYMQTASQVGFQPSIRGYQLRRIIQGILCAGYVYLSTVLL